MTGRLLTLLLLLLLPAAAEAKQIASVSICGASDCVRVSREHVSNERLHQLAGGVHHAEPPAAAAPWYRVEVRVRGDGETFAFTLAYVPRHGLVRGLQDAQPSWSTVPTAARRTFARFTNGLHPLPASRLAFEPAAAQVDEVFTPAALAPSSPRWPWIVAAAAVAAAAIRRGRPFASRTWSGSNSPS